jgi:hypothetical protein
MAVVRLIKQMEYRIQITFQTRINEISQVLFIFLENLYPLISWLIEDRPKTDLNTHLIIQLAGIWSDLSGANFEDLGSEIQRYES